jgi:RNA polymerase sigma-70 factor (ECF subfamily)
LGDLDATDLERCRSGDIAALDALYRAFGDRVYRLCLGLLGQPADAEDAAQEVLLRVLRRASTFGGRGKFSTWVYRLAVNHCLNASRRRRRGGDLARATSLSDLAEGDEPAWPGPSPLESAGAADEGAALAAVLRRLRPAHRVALVLREAQGLSYREMAEVLAVPVGTVMSRLARARAALAELLPPRGAAAPGEDRGGEAPKAPVRGTALAVEVSERLATARRAESSPRSDSASPGEDRGNSAPKAPVRGTAPAVEMSQRLATAHRAESSPRSDSAPRPEPSPDARSEGPNARGGHAGRAIVGLGSGPRSWDALSPR